MPVKFTHESEPVQVGVCPTCAAPVKVIIRTSVYPANGGQLVYRRYLYTCEGCGNTWAHTKVPYYRNNSNDTSTDPLGSGGANYTYADVLGCFLSLRDYPLPRYV